MKKLSIQTSIPTSILLLTVLLTSGILTACSTLNTNPVQELQPVAQQPVESADTKQPTKPTKQLTEQLTKQKMSDVRGLTAKHQTVTDEDKSELVSLLVQSVAIEEILEIEAQEQKHQSVRNCYASRSVYNESLEKLTEFMKHQVKYMKDSEIQLYLQNLTHSTISVLKKYNTFIYRDIDILFPASSNHLYKEKRALFLTGLTLSEQQDFLTIEEMQRVVPKEFAVPVGLKTMRDSTTYVEPDRVNIMVGSIATTALFGCMKYPPLKQPQP